MKPRSDLGIRTLSGAAMMSVAITAIWLGGLAFTALVTAVGLGVLFEFGRLVTTFEPQAYRRALWLAGGAFYVGLACFTLLFLGAQENGLVPAVILIAGVIGTDIGAYFSGRIFGGPKIAPKISPSKTWSGLFGGMVGAGILMNAANALSFSGPPRGAPGDAILAYEWPLLFLAGLLLAIVAQAGDFFESWMKRRAGVKDSGSLIPGHGGLFDRADGLIAVCFFSGLFLMADLW